MNNNITVVEDETLSAPYDRRYVVINKDNGEVVDNAQGYGYKSVQKAYSAYGYKNRDKSKDKGKADKRKHIRQWLKEHKDFAELMEITAIEIAKGSWGEGVEFDTKLVRRMLAENNLEIDFTVSDLIKVWRKS